MKTNHATKTRSLTELATEVISRCRKLAFLSEDSDTIRRTFLSPPMHEVHQQITSWLEPLNASVKIDAVGNLRALWPPDKTSTPRLLVGSHLDTVPNAGAFDGILGVVLVLALLEALEGHNLPFAIELIGFSEEEGVRFATPFIGSRAVVGRVDDSLFDAKDAQGISVYEAIEQFGLDPKSINDACISENAFAYLEFHIEQGPVLEQLGLPLAAVDAIAGQTRMAITFLGRANHAGTTPMNLRADAVSAAAEWITRVERIANATPGLVATVGSIQAIPGASNVIAGEARLTLDVRHANDEVRARAIESFTSDAAQIARDRGLTITVNTHMNQAAVAMDPFLVRQIELAIRKAGCPPHRMVSGAGHDAMILAEKVPSAMIFLRSPGGISHNPAESVLIGDVEKAIECGLRLLEQLSSESAFLKRTPRA